MFDPCVCFSIGERNHNIKAKCPPQIYSFEHLNPDDSVGKYFICFWHDGSVLLCTFNKRGDVLQTLKGKDIFRIIFAGLCLLNLN